jgi:hypothetical protein
MKKLLRKWFGIDEIIKDQNRNLNSLLHVIEINGEMLKKLEEISDLRLDEKLEKVDENTKKLNQMLLELKGVVEMTRAMVKQEPKKKTVSRTKKSNN